jgi:hypothetical protein
MPAATTPSHPVVAGDVVIEDHLYAGERYSLTTRDRRGAHLLGRLIDALLTEDRGR